MQKKTNWQHQNTTETIDYATPRDRLRTVRRSKNMNPIAVVKPVNGYPIFLITATAV